jgi:outer membrane protein
MRLAGVLMVAVVVHASLLACASTASAQTPAPAPTAPPLPATPPPTPESPTLSLPELLSRPITVDEAVSFALEAQPLIQARLADYAAARARVAQAFSPLLPQLTGTWNAQRDQAVTNNSSFGPQAGQARTFWTTTTSARVSLSQILFDFGKTAAATEVARKNAEVSFQNIELQRQQLVDTIKEAYTNIVFAERLIKVQEQALQRADLNLRSARGFFEVGTQPRSVVTRAEVDVANAKVAIIQARNAGSLARVALNTAMGIAADASTQVIDNLAYAPVSIDQSTLLREALSRRPEYRQAQLTVEAAEATVKQSVRSFLPTVTGGAFYGGARPEFNEIWELSVGLSWTLFDGGNLIARYREARANLDAAQARVKASELSIAQDVEQARLSLTEADERIQAAKVAVESAQENFRLAQGRFDAGVGTILEVTDAQLALTQAQNTEAQALADFRIAQARLDRALGRR